MEKHEIITENSTIFLYCTNNLLFLTFQRVLRNVFCYSCLGLVGFTKWHENDTKYNDTSIDYSRLDLSVEVCQTVGD